MLALLVMPDFGMFGPYTAEPEIQGCIGSVTEQLCVVLQITLLGVGDTTKILYHNMSNFISL